ncbi:MAG TPA: hypothetical protein VF576_05725 [Rubricoccaceae bacterium]|jgi:hypothetical protein
MSTPSLLLVVLALALSLPVAAQEYVPAYGRGGDDQTGTEVVLVYFGSATCAPCHLDEFKAALERAKVLLHERAEADGKAFAVVGVAVDHNVEDGLAFLAGTGRFDELVVGRNWFNSAALAHIWRAEGLEDRFAGLPGVMVFEREMTVGETGISASPPTYLVELVGARRIGEWVAAGAPLE